LCKERERERERADRGRDGEGFGLLEDRGDPLRLAFRVEDLGLGVEG